MNKVISTDRLELRSPHMDFALPLLQYYSENAEWLKRWSPLWPANYLTVHAMRDKLQSLIISENDLRSFGFLLFLAGEGKICGTINYSNIVWGGFKSCFLSYQLGELYTGKGLMTEALYTTLKYVFEERKLHRVEANIMPANKKSVNLVKNLGFQCEGISPEYLEICGKWETHEHWVLLNNSELQRRWFAIDFTGEKKP